MMTDADIEMAEAVAVGRTIAYQQQAGVCCHLSAVGWVPEAYYPERVGLLPGQVRCRDGCGQVFASDEAWHEAIEEALYG